MALLAAAALTGCSSGSEPTRPPEPTPVADYGSHPLSRIAFCDLVPEKSVTAALGGPAEADRSWDNGDQTSVAGAGPDGDVIHELGCEWTRGTGPAGTAARAWVFARPVDPTFAADLVAQASTRKGCAVTTPPPAFGSPSLLQTCPVGARRERVRHAGLFGDTWLTCEVVGPRADAASPAGLSDRAGAWCVTVADSLRTAARTPAE